MCYKRRYKIFHVKCGRTIFILSKTLDPSNCTLRGIAWLYPAIIDGAIIVFSLSVLRANLTRERTVYPWVLVSVFTLLSVVLNIIHAQQELLAQFLAAIPPVALFLSFELLLAHLKETAVRLEAQNSLDEIVREIREKESELDGIVRNRTETIEKLEGEIGRSKSTVGGYLSEMQVANWIKKGELGWKVLKDVGIRFAK
ncbi:MAG: hypothetical protein CL609_10810 [Anaerolineaceae bacterium]|nr:hypothetical protein [Anaerolineaceae bacterium]